MQWPEKPTCHGERDPYLGEVVVWRPATPEGRPYDKDSPNLGPYAEPFRTCSFCGSMHPEDLLNWMQRGAQVHGSDWKYGWPHKFYVDNIPNPIAGREVQKGSHPVPDLDPESGGRWVQEPTLGPAPEHTHGKWYNDHLLDAGYDDEAWNSLVEALAARTGIHFFRDAEKGLMYRAPSRGYQR
jgi:hypothetical protein